MRATIHVVFETITDDSASNGDHADHGFVHPETERQHSMRTKRTRERTLRLSKRGRLDWPSLRAAIEYCESQYTSERDAAEGQVDSRLQARYFGERDDEGTWTNVTLFVENVSDGTLSRLARCLETRRYGKQVRFY